LDPANEVISRGENVFVGWSQKQFGDNGHSLQPIRLFLMITASFRSLRRIELDSSANIRQTIEREKRERERMKYSGSRNGERNPHERSRIPSWILKKISYRTLRRSYIPENWIVIFSSHPLRPSLSLYSLSPLSLSVPPTVLRKLKYRVTHLAETLRR